MFDIRHFRHAKVRASVGLQQHVFCLPKRFSFYRGNSANAAFFFPRNRNHLRFDPDRWVLNRKRSVCDRLEPHFKLFTVKAIIPLRIREHLLITVREPALYAVPHIFDTVHLCLYRQGEQERSPNQHLCIVRAVL